MLHAMGHAAAQHTVQPRSFLSLQCVVLKCPGVPWCAPSRKPVVWGTLAFDPQMPGVVWFRAKRLRGFRLQSAVGSLVSTPLALTLYSTCELVLQFPNILRAY